MDSQDSSFCWDISMETAVFCWGNTMNGELGLGGIEEDHILLPRRLNTFAKETLVRDISCGRNHTVIVLSDGTVYSCGNNDMGQLGHLNARRKPEQVRALFAHIIRLAQCGNNHTLAVSEAGQVFSWGCNTHGQLGLGIDDEYLVTPKMIKTLATLHVTQVSCGANHSLALTNNGQLYSWGQNNFGQLGLGNRGDRHDQPALVTALAGVPIAHITAGGYHNLVLTVSGSIFSWGKNMFGQLGLNDNTDRPIPTPQLTLRSQCIKYVCCGEEHSAALTKEGGLFTWGAGMYGQLGHCSKSNEILPRQIMEMMGSIVTQVACGRCHTLAYIPSKKRIYSFGLGGNGQLGISSTRNHSSPSLVTGQWTDASHGTNSTSASEEPSSQSQRAPDLPGKNPDGIKAEASTSAAGQSFSATTMVSPEKSEDEDMETKDTGYSVEVKVQELSADSSDHCLEAVEWEPFVEEPMDETPSGISKKINSNVRIDECASDDDCKFFSVYKVICGGDQSFLMTAFMNIEIESQDFRMLPAKSQSVILKNDVLEEVPKLTSNDCVPQELMSFLETTFSSSACINASYLNQGDSHYFCTEKNSGVNVSEAYRGFHLIEESTNPTIPELIYNCIQKDLLPALTPVPPSAEAMRVYLILPLCHLFQKPDLYLDGLIIPFAQTVLRLFGDAAKIIDQWWGQLEIHHFKNLIQIYKKSIVHIINILGPETAKENSEHETLHASLEFLGRLHSVNKLNGSILQYQEFYIPEVTEKINIKYDYFHWLQVNKDQQRDKFFFCDYPFVFDAHAKTVILQTDSAIQMQTAVDTAFRHNLANLLFPLPVVDPVNPFLVLRVARDKLVDDTINQLYHQTSTDLKKPLKVIFNGEDAIDAGGVKKEFFLLLLREVLDPKYGMFVEYPETRCFWFSAQTFEEDVMFYIIGILCGLAIYNFTIINLPFPLALYKKLLKEPLNLEDVKGLSPSLAKSLQDLLQYEGDDVEDVFLLNFEISMNVLGEVANFELMPNGKNIQVTKDNREEFIQLYIGFLLDKSVETSFKAFSDGFYKVCSSRILELFQALELMTLIIGSEDYDWQLLEKHAKYTNGYDKNHSVIQMFWKVFHSLSIENKRKFLLFLTGSDRVPILGMKTVEITFQPMHVDDDHLPVAHTCFNLLDLPLYSSETALRQKLLQAIQHTQGFGLV